jgi:hypothetical protein
MNSDPGQKQIDEMLALDLVSRICMAVVLVMTHKNSDKSFLPILSQQPCFAEQD